MNAYIDALDRTEDLAALWVDADRSTAGERYATLLLVRALVQATKAIVIAIEGARNDE